MKNKKSGVIGGLVWTFGERIFAQFVTTLVTIILARILDPIHYGVISIVTVFISICNVFVTNGFGSSLVQKKDSNDDDFNTAFILSLTLSIILYIIIFIIAPYVAEFYKMDELTPVMRVMGIRIILASLNSIQQAHIQKNMRFKQFFIATSFGTVISAIVGITLAYFGFGVWALVAQYLTNTTIDTIVLYITGSWKPRITFNKESAKRIFSFGSRVLVTELIFTTAGDIRSLVIGKCFGKDELAYFDQGKRYPAFLVNNINVSINKVMLPTYSNKQENSEELKKILRKSIKVGMYLLTPILVGFAIIAPNFVNVILTEKWINTIPYIQIYCISYLTRPFESSCHQALLAIGKSGLVLKIISIINVVSLFLLFIATFTFRSIFLIAFSSIIATLVSLLCFMFSTKKYLNYNYYEQFSDIFPSIMLSFIMGVPVYCIYLLTKESLNGMLLQISIGIVIYIIFSIITKNDSFSFLVKKIKGVFYHEKKC